MTKNEVVLFKTVGILLGVIKGLLHLVENYMIEADPQAPTQMEWMELDPVRELIKDIEKLPF